MIHGDNGRGGAPEHPDGPPPAREQLPLPRRRRQAHIEPHLRAPDSAGGGGGTPFAAFTADNADETPCSGQDGSAKDATAERAAAFHAGASRGRGAEPRRPDPRRADPGRPDPGRADYPRRDPRRADPGRSGPATGPGER